MIARDGILATVGDGEKVLQLCIVSVGVSFATIEAAIKSRAVIWKPWQKAVSRFKNIESMIAAWVGATISLVSI